MTELSALTDHTPTTDAFPVPETPIRAGLTVTRRSAIGICLIAGAGLVVGCGSDDTPPATSTTGSAPSGSATTAAPASGSATTTAGEPPAPTAATSSASSAESSAVPPAEPSAAPSPESVPAAPPANAIAAVADIPDGGSLVVGSDETPIALAKTADGGVVAHSAKCTHMGCKVTAEGAVLHCFCHHSRFEATTGALINGPAQRPLAEVAIAVQSGSVVLV